jgi:hypothetical protein
MRQGDKETRRQGEENTRRGEGRRRVNLLVSLSPLLLVSLSGIAGCQPLKVEKTISIFGGGVEALIFDAPRYEQKVNVQVSSPGAPVSVYLVKESDMEKARESMERGKTPTSSLAGKDGVEEITLEATVPSGTAYALLIRADKMKAEAKVKLTGR